MKRIWNIRSCSFFLWPYNNPLFDFRAVPLNVHIHLDTCPHGVAMNAWVIMTSQLELSVVFLSTGLWCRDDVTGRWLLPEQPGQHDLCQSLGSWYSQTYKLLTLTFKTVFHSCQGQVTCPKSRLLAMCGSEIAVLLNRAFWMQIDAKFERWYFKGMIVQLIFSFPYTKAQCVITCFIKCLGYMYFIINKYFKVLHRNPNATEIRGMTSIWFDVHLNMGIILRILLYIIIREF